MIVWFEEPADRASIGGKGFNLSVMMRAGLPIPPGFCIPADDLANVSLSSISSALGRLGTAVAVRSSAVEEDSAGNSFAGIYLTVLNMRSAEEVLEAVSRIRDSSHAPAAVAYRKRKGIAGKSRIAVIVQSLIPAETSGVLFMRNPVNLNSGLVIEASWGLGETVVAGKVIPDRWELSSEGHLVSVAIAAKDIQTVPDARGTTEMTVTPERRRAACLSNESLPSLVDLAHRCERVFGCPQDMEWAFARDRFWILQSRPIAGSFPEQ